MNLDKLTELAKKASPGPWTVNSDHFHVCTTGCSNVDGKDYSVHMNGYKARDGAFSDAKTDAEYIAAVNPKNIINLLRLLDEAADLLNDNFNGECSCDVADGLDGEPRGIQCVICKVGDWLEKFDPNKFNQQHLKVI
jgi:hypothetical protein